MKLKTLFFVGIMTLVLCACKEENGKEAEESGIVIQEETADIMAQQEETGDNQEVLRERKTVLTFIVEGLEEEVAVTLFEGNGYSLYIPDEGWQMTQSEFWQSDMNGTVQLWITDYGRGDSIDVIMERFANIGYTVTEEDSSLLSHQEDDYINYVRLFENKDRVIGVFYCYPTEATEGFGSRLHTIASTFEWSDR